MATTTTFALIRDETVANIKAITPNKLSDKLFDRCPRRYTLRAWATEQAANSSCFRKFEVVRGGGEEPPDLDPTSFKRNEIMLVSVAYPVLPTLYGTEELEDMRDIIRRDAADIRDVVFSSGNYLAGQSAALPLGMDPPEEGDVWFQTLRFQLIYQESQTLT